MNNILIMFWERLFPCVIKNFALRVDLGHFYFTMKKHILSSVIIVIYFSVVLI